MRNERKMTAKYPTVDDILKESTKEILKQHIVGAVGVGADPADYRGLRPHSLALWEPTTSFGKTVGPLSRTSPYDTFKQSGAPRKDYRPKLVPIPPKLWHGCTDPSEALLMESASGRTLYQTHTRVRIHGPEMPEWNENFIRKKGISLSL
jgi:hypothetical protein